VGRRRIEPDALRLASGIIAVSDSYGKTLADNYPWFDAGKVQLLPFGASVTDFEALANYRPAQPLINFGDGLFHHVYAGRCGPDMRFAMSALFRAFKFYLNSHPEIAPRRVSILSAPTTPRRRLPVMAMPSRKPRASRRTCKNTATGCRTSTRSITSATRTRSRRSAPRPHLRRLEDLPYILARRRCADLSPEQPGARLRRQASVGMRFSFSGPEDIVPLAEEVYRRWFVEGGRQVYTPSTKRPSRLSPQRC